MATRRSWVVFVDDSSQLEHDNDFPGKLNPYNGKKEILSVFIKESIALQYAKYIAERFPGKDVHVYKQTFCFSSQSKPVETKQWNDNGELVPL